MRMLTLLGIGVVTAAAAIHTPASATPAPPTPPACQTEMPAATTSPTYTCLNGSTTFPGTYVGTVAFGDNNVRQIGDVRAYNSGGAGAYVTIVANPSIYSFNWAGGDLTILEAIGNNGTGVDVGIELFTLSSSTATTVAAPISSIMAPHTGTVFASNTLFAGYLMAGYYAVDTFLMTGGNTTDPDYQINFNIPEPASATILAGIAAVALVRRRRTNDASA